MGAACLGQNDEKPRLPGPVSILLPVYNEADGIEAVVSELIESVFKFLPTGSEILVEEGGSDDGTPAVLQRLAAKWPFVKVTSMPAREGFGPAARALYSRARCPYLFFSDSDGQCVPAEFWKLARELESADFVLGAKQRHQDPFHRRIASRGFNLLVRWLFSAPGTDINYGFRLCRTDKVLAALKSVGHMPSMLNAELILVAHAMGFRIREVPVSHRARPHGKSRILTPTTVLIAGIRTIPGLLGLRYELRGSRAGDGRIA